MSTTENAVCHRQRAYRRRIAAKGRLQFIADLPRETVAFIDDLKERQGLRNRGQVLEHLIEIGRTVTAVSSRRRRSAKRNKGC
jgi:hypothetical protein